MRITFFGSSITSAYWNGAATYYRGICGVLHQLGHEIVFVEQDIYQRQLHRDMAENPDYAEVVVCSDIGDLDRELERAKGSDLVVKCSGVGRYDDYLDRAVLSARTGRNLIAYWDVDAPFTLDRASREPDWYFRDLIPDYNAILTYGGGPRVEAGYRALGAAEVELVYNAVDMRTHHPVEPDPSHSCDLLLIANRLPDREARIGLYFIEVARLCPEHGFSLGGEGWGDVRLPPNIRYLGHVETSMHNRLNCSAHMVLNVNRQAMADYGFSPPTRIFEAAGAGACLITDKWDGIDLFLEPGSEVLVASTPEEVAGFVTGMSRGEAKEIGMRARERVLQQHTYRHRGEQMERFLGRLQVAS